MQISPSKCRLPLTPSLPASSSPSSPTAGTLGLLACSMNLALTDGFGSVAGGADPFTDVTLGRGASSARGLCFLAIVGGGDFGFLASAAASREGFLPGSVWSPFASSSGLFFALAFRTVLACRPFPS